MLPVRGPLLPQLHDLVRHLWDIAIILCQLGVDRGGLLLLRLRVFDRLANFGCCGPLLHYVGDLGHLLRLVRFFANQLEQVLIDYVVGPVSGSELARILLCFLIVL